MKDESENPSANGTRVQVAVQFGGYGVNENGEVTLRWKAPESELAYATQTVLFISMEAIAAIRFLDDETGTHKGIRLGRVVFKRLTVNEKGDSQIVLRSDTDSLVLRLDQLGQLINRAMDLVLKELVFQGGEAG